MSANRTSTCLAPFSLANCRTSLCVNLDLLFCEENPVYPFGDAYLRGNLKQKALQKYLEASKLYSDPAEKEKLEKKIDELKRSLGQNSSNSSRKAPRTPAAVGGDDGDRSESEDEAAGSR